MKSFNGKAIYCPKGKAAEYAAWACNFYVGCSNGCEYCYCKKGILASVMGQDKPQLKKCFENEYHAFDIYLKELEANIEELKKHGLFFSFSTDPMLDKTIDLTIDAALNAVMLDIPVKILTKRAEWVDEFLKYFGRHEINIHYEIYGDSLFETKKHLWAFGFTLTGHDELEPNASTNAERIEAMEKLHDAGFKTFASIEPIIDFDSSWLMIVESFSFCDLYKIGLESGKKYDVTKLIDFCQSVTHFLSGKSGAKIYWKESIIKATGINRSELPANCVTKNFNLFK